MLNNNSKNPDCRLCGEKNTRSLGSQMFLSKYTAQYYQCQNCFYLFVDPVTWLDEAYKLDTTLVDTGRYLRNNTIKDFILRHLPQTTTILDYGSGYELLLKRALGLTKIKVHGYDKYIPTLNDNSLLEQKYDLIVAAEVFEHLMDPLDFLKWAMNHCSTLLLTTTVMDLKTYPNDAYYSRPYGQHIGFFTAPTLEWVRKTLNVKVQHTVVDGVFHFIKINK